MPNDEFLEDFFTRSLEAEFKKIEEDGLHAILSNEGGSIEAVLDVPPEITPETIERLISRGGRLNVVVRLDLPAERGTTQPDEEARFTASLIKILPPDQPA